MIICHVWPGLTPAVLWELPFDEWLVFAVAADAWHDPQKQTEK